jgi:hypothetical protein
MKQYNPETHVAVPKTELANSEKARCDLSDILRDEGFLDSLYRQSMIEKCTRQIWTVANRINWEN